MEQRQPTDEAHQSALRSIAPFGLGNVLALFAAPVVFRLAVDTRVSSQDLNQWTAAVWFGAVLLIVGLALRRSMVSRSPARWEHGYSWAQVYVGGALSSALALDMTNGEALTYQLIVMCLLLLSTSFGAVAFAGSKVIGHRYLSAMWLTALLIGAIQGAGAVAVMAAVMWPASLAHLAFSRRLFSRSAREHRYSREVARELALQSSTDDLTGLLNRRATLQRTQQVMNAGQGVTALFIDLDGFREINDLYGHATGDTVLVNVADQLDRVARCDDIVGRLGSDEFIVVLTEPAEQHLADLIADRFAGEIARSHGAINELAITASIGTARSVDGATAEDLLGCADTAMCRAKARGGNSAVHFLEAHLD